MTGIGLSTYFAGEKQAAILIAVLGGPSGSLPGLGSRTIPTEPWLSH